MKLNFIMRDVKLKPITKWIDFLHENILCDFPKVVSLWISAAHVRMCEIFDFILIICLWSTLKFWYWFVLFHHVIAYLFHAVVPDNAFHCLQLFLNSNRLKQNEPITTTKSKMSQIYLFSALCLSLHASYTCTRLNFPRTKLKFW